MSPSPRGTWTPRRRGQTVEPVERVWLGTKTVTDELAVTEDVRKEHIEVYGDVDDNGR